MYAGSFYYYYGDPKSGTIILSFLAHTVILIVRLWSKLISIFDILCYDHKTARLVKYRDVYRVTISKQSIAITFEPNGITE